MKTLQDKRWWPWPPEPDPQPWKVNPDFELMKDAVFAELVYEAIMRDDLHSSSRVLKTIKENGMLQEVITNQLQAAQEIVKGLEQQLESMKM